jgi:rhodanese-related sulfurtransferase
MEKMTFALLMTLVAVFAFVATGMIEDKVNKRPVSLLSGNWKRKTMAAILPVVILLLVMASPSRNEYIMRKLEAEAASGKCQPSLIEADKLAFELVNNYYQYNLIDVRSPEEFKSFHIATAINIPLDELTGPEYRQMLNQRFKTNIFYADSPEQAKKACLIARYHGNKTSLALKETASVFQQQFYGEQKFSINPSKQEVTVAQFRTDAAKKLKEIEENLSVMDKPVKKKLTRVQGGCS